MSKFGIESKILHEIRKILNSVTTSKSDYAVYVFGSRAKGTHKKYSDVDLWLEATPKVTALEIASLNTLFEESEIPIKVDIVTPETCLEEYRSRILQERQFWYGS